MNEGFTRNEVYDEDFSQLPVRVAEGERSPLVWGVSDIKASASGVGWDVRIV